MPLTHSSQRYSKVRDYVRGVIYDSLPAHLTGRFHAPVRPPMMTERSRFLQLWREAMGWGSIRIFFLRIFLFFIRLCCNMKKHDAEYFRSLSRPPVRTLCASNLTAPRTTVPPFCSIPQPINSSLRTL